MLDHAVAVTIEREASGTSRVLLARLHSVRRALEKLEEGTYGRCDECGEPIPLARLRIMPEATRCIACASLAETGPAASRSAPARQSALPPMEDR